MKKYIPAKFADLPIVQRLSSEQGSVLVIALLIMAVLAVLGAVASNMSITEMRVAANERSYNQSFYAADGGWQEVPMFMNDEIQGKGKDPTSLNFNPLTTVDPPKQIGNVPYTLAPVILGSQSCGSNCKEFLYQVDASTLDPNDTSKERQRVRVVLAARFTNASGYGNN